MATLQLGADGEVISEDYETPVGDPNAPPRYTDEQLAAALPHTSSVGSEEQASLDRMQAHEKQLIERANAVSGFDENKQPKYVEGAIERARLLRAAKGIRESLVLQLEISKRTIAARYLDDQAKAAALQATADTHTALEKRANEIVNERLANEMADLMQKRNVGGINRR